MANQEEILITSVAIVFLDLKKNYYDPNKMIKIYKTQ